MVMRNHELIKSGAYPYWFAPKVETWREVDEDKDNPSIYMAGGPVMEDFVSSLLELSLSSGPNPRARFSPVIPTAEALQTLSVVSAGSNGRSLDMRSAQ
ncbi:hypothetical protein AYI68_g3215 [Smittium mucronatum]|uniref:Uncharacterized protein n=1 Tax=Smittium mucronatum TaxID=133383 RepID=A0A1R0H0I6_9FUNG|nr:hypothetical protein AYI68_g3215 [Smittium mucronatum]